MAAHAVGVLVGGKGAGALSLQQAAKASDADVALTSLATDRNSCIAVERSQTLDNVHKICSVTVHNTCSSVVNDKERTRSDEIWTLETTEVG